MPSTSSRYIEALVADDLRQKMVFVSGPRQVGKTTFATHLRPPSQTRYLNWDLDEDRIRILEKNLGTEPLLILDEIHKFRRWRNFLNRHDPLPGDSRDRQRPS